MGSREHEWVEYYEKFDYFRPEKIRDGCHPRIREHRDAEASVVLVHGLSDSPYFMSAIANHFHQELKYNVYLPLLHFHGLKKPGGMEGVELEEWKRNVLWSVKYASEKTEKVSIGGLSTGGALSFYTACYSPRVTGDLFLFSAALDLVVARSGSIGDITERLLRNKFLTWILDRFDEGKPLVGNNPYKYDYVDKDGARELAKLIKETDALLESFDLKHPFQKKTFAAHSYADETADIDGIIELKDAIPRASFDDFFIDSKKGVTHAGLVLQEDLVLNGEILEKGNSEFDSMMKAITRFVESA